jgi:PAS domain S-box-containing protein
MQTIEPQELLKLISSAYPGLVAYVDSNLCYQFANSRYYEWLNISHEDIVGRKIIDILGDKNFDSRKPLIDRALKGEKISFISDFEHKTLGARIIEQIYDPHIREDGTVMGFIALALDITEQKRIENAAKESEARFRSLTEVMPQLVWIADAEGKIIYLNENWPRVTGTTYEENLGNGWVNVLHPEDRLTTVLSWNETIKGQQDQEVEYRLKMADGSYRWHVSRAIAIKDQDGKTARWVGTTTDIEEQKYARDLALQEKKRLFSLLMQAPVAISVMTGPEHILELVNEPARKHLGNREIKGLPLKEALPELEAQGFFELMDEIYYSGEGKFLAAKPILIQDNKGKKLEVFSDLFYEPIKDESGLTIGILAMAVDVTAQVKALQKAEEKERKLEEALIARDQFLSIASHELKTPLTSLKLQAQLTLRSLHMDREITSQRQKMMAHQTSELVGRLTRLIDDMLDVSRIKTGKLKLDKSEHDLGDIVREVVLQMSVLFEAAHLPIPSIKVDQKLIGHWDRFRLEQVIGNLLTNAIRYGCGKPVEISISSFEKTVLISVKDYGYGIAQEDLKRIFDSFERAINSSEVSGLGLGLFISKEIVESHSGKIWVESELEKGSTFHVSLPLK